MAFWDTFKNWAGDRNVINMLAGTGMGLDPEGVGGALGGSTQKYIQALATQEAIAKENERKQKFAEDYLALLGGGGLTPNTQVGPESLKLTPDKATLDITMPGASTLIPGAGDATTPPSTFGATLPGARGVKPSGAGGVSAPTNFTELLKSLPVGGNDFSKLFQGLSGF